MHPILVVRPDDAPQHAFAGEILRSEGIYFFEEACAQSPDFECWRRAGLIVLLSGSYEASLAQWLVDYVQQGGKLLAFRPEGALAEGLGLSAGPAMPNSRVRVRTGQGLPEAPEDLLCPGHTSNGLVGKGESLAQLLSTHGQPAGDAITAQAMGLGKTVSLAYDPVEICIMLRHGWADYDKPPGVAYHGPRSIWAFKGLECLYSKRVPIGDVHADIVRTLVFDLLADLGVLPRLWHLPQGAKSLFLLKGDGCGEQGVDFEIALAEKHGAKLSFYRPRHSRYPGTLMHEWAQRGHAIAPEFDITSVTHPVTMATVNAEVIKGIRDVVEDHAQSFRAECDLDFHTVCFHGCQWVGLPQVQMVEENDWWMITSFISFYPGMQKEGYGIYTIPSFMPMRYYDQEGGLCEQIYAPAAWDESQSLGEPCPRQAGMSTEEYVAEFERVMTESVERHHLPHVVNFHPSYLVMDPSHARYSGAAAEGSLSVCERLRVPSPNLEDWCKFIRDRWSVNLTELEISPQQTRLKLTSSRGVEGLTVVLDGAGASSHATFDGRDVALRTDAFEGRQQRHVVIDLAANAEAELVVSV